MWPNQLGPDNERLAALRARTEARDAAAALELAQELLRHGGMFDALDVADVAARFGNADVLWQVADLGYHARGYGKDFAMWARTMWARAVRADHPLPVDGQTWVHRDTFGPRFEPPRFTALVSDNVSVTAPDGVALRAALIAATQRWYFVYEDGVERSEQKADDEGALYSPNYVSDPNDGCTTIYVDTKSVGYGLMFRSFLRILVDELASGGVRDAVVAPDVDEELVADGLLWDEAGQAYVQPGAG